jgi:hydrogenase expression/formation protein HypC
MEGGAAMCLAIPGKIIETYETAELKMAKVDFGGITREVCLESVPEATEGQYVVVHVGFAIGVLNEEDALETLEQLRRAGELEKELDDQR